MNLPTSRAKLKKRWMIVGGRSKKKGKRKTIEISKTNKTNRPQKAETRRTHMRQGREGLESRKERKLGGEKKILQLRKYGQSAQNQSLRQGTLKGKKKFRA